LAVTEPDNPSARWQRHVAYKILIVSIRDYQGFLNGMMRYNSKGGFNIPFGRYKTFNFEELKNKDYENLLKRTEIFNKGFEYIFEKYNDSDNFMFLDPPYDSQFTDYGYCKFGKEEHKKLAECFKKTSIKCLMIIGKTPFIEELYDGYISGEYDKKYRFKLHSGRIGNEINTNIS